MVAKQRRYAVMRDGEVFVHDLTRKEAVAEIRRQSRGGMFYSYAGRVEGWKNLSKFELFSYPVDTCPACGCEPGETEGCDDPSGCGAPELREKRTEEEKIG